MKKSLKFLLTMLFLCIFSVMLSFGSSAADSIVSFSVGTASASASQQLGEVSWFKSSADNIYYIFLPNGISKSSLTVNFDSSDVVYCGETQLVSGEETDVFASGKAVLTCAGNSYNVKVIESSGISTAYINTESGSLSAIHADKSYKEAGCALIIDENGNIQYDGSLDYIKGRGNSTWSLDKKPYNIKLGKKTNLFSMGKSKKWCLLANASDTTLIKNALAYDTALNLGVSTTSPTKQLNLYINGEYQGVYMITEKVEVGENRVDIYDLEGATEDANGADLESFTLAGSQNSTKAGSIKYADIPIDPQEITGGYLLELEKIYRYTNEPSGFVTSLRQAVVVKSPEYASKNQVEYISNYYQEFEDALYSSTGYNSLGKHYSEYIDVDSLAQMYILEEFCANFDGCSSSFYLYKDVDGKLVAGPAWDFDLTYGVAMSNNLINHVSSLTDPNLLYIQTCFIGNHNESKNSLLAQAFSHNEFQKRVQEIWAETFKSFYPTLLNNVDSFSSELQSSALMNAVRWNLFGTTDVNAISSNINASVQAVKSYIQNRYSFLSSAYSTDTYFVKYDIGQYGSALVHDTTIYTSGSNAVVLEAPASTDSSVTFLGWSTEPDGNGTIYQAGDNLEVKDNTVLYAQWQTTLDRIKSNSFIVRLKAFFTAIKEFFKKIFGGFGA